MCKWSFKQDDACGLTVNSSGLLILNVANLVTYETVSKSIWCTQAMTNVSSTDQPDTCPIHARIRESIPQVSPIRLLTLAHSPWCLWDASCSTYGRRETQQAQRLHRTFRSSADSSSQSPSPSLGTSESRFMMRTSIVWVAIREEDDTGLVICSDDGGDIDTPP